MHKVPYTIVSSAVSVDGFLDDASPERLLLSHTEDFDKIDALRATCDAILVGANTIRNDNPRLRIRSQERIAFRIEKGKPAQPARVTLTASGKVPTQSAFFLPGASDSYIYCPQEASATVQRSLSQHATIIPMGQGSVNLIGLLKDLKTRGTNRLLIEGGQSVNTAFLAANLVHELRLAIAPFFVGEKHAPRFVGTGQFPFDKSNRMHLNSLQQIGDMVVATYKVAALSDPELI